MEILNTTVDNFNNVYHNGYTLKPVSVFEKETLKKLTNSIDNAATFGGILPPCHLNFGNLGKIKFPFDIDLTLDPLNLKMFDKLNRISNIIRDINSRVIRMIEELECCGIAALYNSTVVPILEWFLQDFINTLADIAESILKSYEVFKVMSCIIRPVPGNPWLRSGGFDFLTGIYSFINGLETVYTWLVDGNPIDIILNPLESLQKSIASCAPRVSAEREKNRLLTSNNLLLLKDTQNMLRFKSEVARKDSGNLSELNITIDALQVNSEKLNELLREQSEIEIRNEANNINEDSYFNTPISQKDEERVQTIQSEIYKLSDEFNNLKDYKKQVENIIEEEQKTNKNILNNKYNSEITIDKNADLLISQAYNPSCNCIMEMISNVTGGTFKPIKYVTVNTWESFDTLLDNQISWKDKDLWKSSMKKVRDNKEVKIAKLSEIYLHRENIDRKYQEANSKIDRDLTTSLAYMGGSFVFDVLGNDLEKTIIDYNYYSEDSAGIVFRKGSIDLLGIDGFDGVEVYVLYTDSGTQNHQTFGVSSIFNLNADRMEEKHRVLKLMNISQSTLRLTELKMEELWNELYRQSLKKVKYTEFKLNAQDIDINSTYFETVASLSNNLDIIVKGAQESYTGQQMLNLLGNSFDPLKFVETFLDSSSFDNFNSPELKDIISDYTTTRYNWLESYGHISICSGAINRLDTLINIDNVVVSIVDNDLQICGCDIVCKLLQYFLDMLISGINNLIQTITNRLAKMIIGEKIAYIIKFITEKIKCFLMAGKIADNINTIKRVSKALQDKNDQSLDRLVDPDWCNIHNNRSDIVERLLQDEILIVPDPGAIEIDPVTGNSYKDPIIEYMPAYNVSNPNDVDEPKNTLVNNGATLGKGVTGRNVPEFLLECTDSVFPSVEMEMETRSKYEILIGFIPGESIIDSPVDIIEQVYTDPIDGLTDTEGNPIDVSSIVNPIMSLSEIMNKVNEQVQSAIDSPIYIKTDCDTTVKKNSNDLTLCSRDNLVVNSIVLLENDTIVSDEHLGKISPIRYYDSNIDVFEYFPEHEEADESGMVQVLAGNPYWTYSIPNDTIVISDPDTITFSEEVMLSDVVPDNSETITKIIDRDFKEITTDATTEIKFEDMGDHAIKTTTNTIITTTRTPFRYPKLEFLVEFKNSVNNFKVRALLDVIALELGDAANDYISNYMGRYLEYVELGTVPNTKGIYNISFNRLLFLSRNILKSNYLITNAAAVAETAKTAISISEPNKCLLPSEQKEAITEVLGSIDNINLTIENSTQEVNTYIDNLNVPEIVEISEPQKIEPLQLGIPFLVLNKDLNIMVQIVNRKLFLQFPGNNLTDSKPVIIDYELIPGELYMFTFNISGLVFTMTLITPDKQIFTVTGMNTSLVELLPTIIGGNVERTRSMCSGSIIDLIVSKSGTGTIDYYNRSIMSYIPRQAQIIFDFSIYQGSRVYNNINSAGNVYIGSDKTGSYYNNFGNGAPTEASKQQADFYGDIISNRFYQVLNGYMDNFFCRDNLKNTDFTISFWLYNNNSKSNKHMMISDDINHNYIYYDASQGRIVIDFNGMQDKLFIPIILKSWVNVMFKRDRFQSKYYLIITEFNGKKHEIEFSSKSNFFLMSLLAMYDRDSKSYRYQFKGYMGALSIFLQNIDKPTYKELIKNQKTLVQGMES